METINSVGQAIQVVQIHAYGGPEVLALEKIPMPTPGAHEVLVRVQGAGVNPVDWKIRSGYRKDQLRHVLPLILGWDVAGVVEKAGEGAVRFKPGDRVFGLLDRTRDGAYAEYLAAPEEVLAASPRSLDALHAAAVPLAALTAWQGLFEVAGLSSGQTVLIHAAAGGVGHFAVQLAKWKGARVIGTSSESNLRFIQELGADQAIDYQAVPFEDVARDVDVVFDGIGGETQARSLKTIKPGGVLVALAGVSATEGAAKLGVSLKTVFVKPHAGQLAQIAQLIDAGTLRPEVTAIFSLAEAARAQALSQAGHVRGKIVLKIAE